MTIDEWDVNESHIPDAGSISDCICSSDGDGGCHTQIVYLKPKTVPYLPLLTYE